VTPVTTDRALKFLLRQCHSCMDRWTEKKKTKEREKWRERPKMKKESNLVQREEHL